MLGWLLAFVFVASFWPMMLQWFVVALFVWSLIGHIPNIAARQDGATRWWAVLGVIFLVEVAATWLVMQNPAAFGKPIIVEPTTTLALLAGGWALFAWIIALEIPARIERQRQERLLQEGESIDEHLQPF